MSACILDTSCNFIQVSKAALEEYTGEGEPPICQMTLTASDDNPIDLSLPVNLSGVRKGDTLQIKRPAEGDVYICMKQTSSM